MTNKIIDFIKPKKFSRFSEILVCAAIVYASYAFFYEDSILFYGINNPENINLFIKYIYCFVLIAVWITVSINQGYHGRISFVIFTVCFWIVPTFIFYILSLYDLQAITDVNLILLVNIILFAAKIITFSLSVLSGHVTGSYTESEFGAVFYVNFLFIIAFISAFFISYFIGEAIRKRKKIRLRNTAAE